MPQQIQLRRDSSANWTTNNPTLAEGEMGVVTDTYNYKIGDGVTPWNTLDYYQLSPALSALTFNNTTDPSTPAADTLVLYSKSVSGRSLPKYIGPSGLSSPLQPAIFQNSFWLVQPNTTTAVSTIGGAVTSVGTISHPNPSSTSNGFCTNFVSGAVAGNTAGTGSTVAQFNLASGVANCGGFFFVTRLWYPDANYGTGATGSRHFVGLTDQTMAASVGADNPAGSRLGFSLSTNLSETNWMFTSKDGTTETKVSTGMAFAVGKLYDFFIYARPGGTTVYWRIDNITDGTTFEGEATTTLPGSGTFMRGGFQLATLTTVARNVRMKKIYIETDN